MRVLLVLVLLAAVVWALIECIQAENSEIRLLSKPIWIIVIILVPFGAVAWFLLGRPKATAGAPGRRPAGGTSGGRPGWVAPRDRTPRPAPDDDPEFLRRLAQHAEQQKKLRLLEEGGAAPEQKKSDPGPEAEGKDENPGAVS